MVVMLLLGEGLAPSVLHKVLISGSYFRLRKAVLTMMILFLLLLVDVPLLEGVRGERRGVGSRSLAAGEEVLSRLELEVFCREASWQFVEYGEHCLFWSRALHLHFQEYQCHLLMAIGVEVVFLRGELERGLACQRLLYLVVLRVLPLQERRGLYPGRGQGVPSGTSGATGKVDNSGSVWSYGAWFVHARGRARSFCFSWVRWVRPSTQAEGSSGADDSHWWPVGFGARAKG